MSKVIFNNSKFSKVEPIPKLNLPEIEEVECVTPINNAHREYLFYCKPTKSDRKGCPQCGSVRTYSHGFNKDRLIHDVSIGLCPVFLQLKTPRYRCEDCGATFNHRYDDIQQNGMLTRRLEQQIKERAINEPFSSIAEEYNISVPTVKKMMLEYGGKLLEERGELIAPEILALDEKHIQHRMCAVFVDGKEGNLIEMTSDNKRQTITKTIQSMKEYEKIRVVTVDMNNAYRPMLEEVIPWAKIIVDKFHVLQDHHRKVQECKTLVTSYLKEQIKAMPAGEEKDYKDKLLTQMGKNNWLFKFGIKKLAKMKRNSSLMSELCTEFPEINTLRLLKEGLELMYEANSREEAEKVHKQWAKLVKEADKDLFKPMKSMLRTTQRWHEEIFGFLMKIVGIQMQLLKVLTH